MVHQETLPTPSIPANSGVWTFSGESTISAPASRVWSVLRDFATYPKWNSYTPAITTPSGTNAIEVGDMITLAYRPKPSGRTTDIPCRIVQLSEEEMRICWRGCAFGIPGALLLPEKVQVVEEVEGGERCVFRIWETQGGPLAWVVRGVMGSKLQGMNQGIAEDLKAYVEGGMGEGA